MKKLLFLFLCITPILLFSQKPLSNEAVAVEVALEQIKEATAELSRTGYFNGRFDVRVRFNNVVSDDNGVDFNIWFLSFNTRRNKSINNSYTAKYTFSTTEKSSLIPLKFKNNLAKVLNNGIQAYKNVSPGAMSRNGFEIVSSFTLEKSIGGGGSVVIAPVTIGAIKKRSKRSVHSVTLTFTPQ